MPQDVVELSHKHNDNFQAHETYNVKHIGPKQPNTLQLVDDDGNTTFVSHRDIKVIEEVGQREDGREPSGGEPIDSRYLNWP